MFPATITGQSDLSTAVAAAKAAAAAAVAARAAPLKARAKSVAADLVTEADGRAEAAAVEILRAHRPDDAIAGEEGADHAGTGSRRWWIDGIDGTVAFANDVPSWCSAVALEDERGPLASAIYDPVRDELYAGARGEASAARVRAGRPLAEAHVAAFFRQDRLVLPGVREVAHRLLDATGLLRHAGPGSLELAWVATGRLDAWIQPATDPWDWHPGALLVTEAGGETRVIQARTRWHIAGPSALVDELAALVT